MDIYQIVYTYLKDNGYDGLCAYNCGCGLDDLMPCETPLLRECVPAIKRKATKKDIDPSVDFKIGDEVYFPANP